jgi:hypothetical protein
MREMDNVKRNKQNQPIHSLANLPAEKAKTLQYQDCKVSSGISDRFRYGLKTCNFNGLRVRSHYFFAFFRFSVIESEPATEFMLRPK